MARDYFAEEPFGCRCGCGLDRLDPELRHILNGGREECGFPWVITSGCRCRDYNASIGGATNSAHTPGPDGVCHAVDIRAIHPVTQGRILEALWRRGIRRFEFSNRHIHADNADGTFWPRPMVEVLWFGPDGKRAK